MKTVLRVFVLLAILAGLSLPARAQDTATKSLTLTVNPATVAFTSGSLPNGEIGLAYTGVTLQASGGIAPYAFTMTSGSLPGGISLAINGAFSGTPTATGTFAFTAQVADSETPPVTASKSFSITVYNGLTITTTSLPPANAGVAYSAQLAASGGISPYLWSITSGALPTGLTLSTGGLISGTPTATGSFTFTIQVTDSASGAPAVVRARGTTLIIPR